MDVSSLWILVCVLIASTTGRADNSSTSATNSTSPARITHVATPTSAGTSVTKTSLSDEVAYSSAPTKNSTSPPPSVTKITVIAVVGYGSVILLLVVGTIIIFCQKKRAKELHIAAMQQESRIKGPAVEDFDTNGIPEYQEIGSDKPGSEVSEEEATAENVQSGIELYATVSKPKANASKYRPQKASIEVTDQPGDDLYSTIKIANDGTMKETVRYQIQMVNNDLYRVEKDAE